VEKKRVLIACGTAIATATVIAKKVKEFLDEQDIPAVIEQCKAAEAAAKAQIFRADLIVGATYIPGDTKGIPVVMGTAFLSGMKLDETKQKILEALNVKKD
jgi:PTS system galactitol-specific IIB component